MNLLSYHLDGQSVEALVREMMRSQGFFNPTHEECRQWVRDFIIDLIPEYPGHQPTTAEWELVGRQFRIMQCRVRGVPVK